MFLPIFFTLLLSVCMPIVRCDEVDCEVDIFPCNDTEGVKLTEYQYVCCPTGYSMVLATTCTCVRRSRVSRCLSGEENCGNSTSKVTDDQGIRCCLEDEDISIYTAYPLGVPTNMCRCFGALGTSRRLGWWDRQQQVVRDSLRTVSDLVNDSWNSAVNLANDVTNSVSNSIFGSNPAV